MVFLLPVPKLDGGHDVASHLELPQHEHHQHTLEEGSIYHDPWTYGRVSSNPEGMLGATRRIWDANNPLTRAVTLLRRKSQTRQYRWVDAGAILVEVS